MTNPQIPQFWTVSWPVDRGEGTKMIEESGKTRNEQEARMMAAERSRHHGHANINNREGAFALYVSGVERPLRK